MDRLQAEMIVNACHLAWSSRDLDRMLSFYSPHIIYTCNGEPEGPPNVTVRYVGRSAMRGFLSPLLEVAESVSVVEGFQFDGEKARVNVACYLRHYRTGIVLSGQFRQVVRFEGGMISHLEEFHDAAKLATFWKLVSSTEAMLATTGQSGATPG
jgi:ketosteroid isomerase-like protein